MLDPIYQAIGWLLAFYYSFIPSLGISIILLTATVMLLLFPLTARQARSMIKMQQVQPEIKKIQQQNKDDKQKANEEILKFYQENKINPMSGCLPLVMQMPIFIALFGVLRGLGNENEAGIPDPGSIPEGSDLYKDIVTGASSATEFLGMDLTVSPLEASGSFLETLPYFIVVALIVFTGWYQTRQTMARQKDSGAAANPQMQIIGKVMPVMFGIFSLNFVAGLNIYFLTSNTWRIGQQHLVLSKIYEKAKAESAGALPAESRDVTETPENTSGGIDPNTSQEEEEEAEALMEWIEVTGRTVAEATELALDRLGVSQDDLELDIVSEEKSGFLGMGRADARIRARVKPVSRDKPDTRRRARRDKGDRSGSSKRGQDRSKSGSAGKSAKATKSTKSAKSGGTQQAKASGGGRTPEKPQNKESKRTDQPKREKDMADDEVTLEEQCASAATFLEGVVAALELDATVSASPGEDRVEAEVTGEQLGRLIGPDAATLNALEELTQAVVKTRSGGSGGRVRVDVGGYREQRRTALEAFTREQVQRAVDAGSDVALEPMGSSDRKVVHDVVGELDGVSTTSEGEEPRRRVVIHPAGDA